MQDTHYNYASDNAVFPDRNGEFNLTIDRASQISAYCGQHVNYTGYAMEIVSRVFNMTKTTIPNADGIGPGCAGQNNCNGNGVCNHCDSTCECFNGFGSALDLTTAITDDFNADCSSRVCPLGPAIRNSGSSALSVSSMHRLMECSNNGLCNRLNGTCNCFNGFGGAACEKMDCPGNPTCSGRGMCLPQQYLTIRPDALPLTNSTTTLYTHVSGDITSGASWDAKFGHTCVCDSSWTVGLGADETQKAEYFGPSCEYRHCPTGDNPNTSANETDCEDKSQITGGTNGTSGNLCHIDCSDQGICDYNTGICACFSGYTNSNCGTKS